MQEIFPVIVGMGEIGCSSLSNQAIEFIAKAQVLCGSKRFLDFFPDFQGEAFPLPMAKKNMLESIQSLVEMSTEKNLVILASGDPHFFGIADLARKYWKQLTVIPSLSSMQLAFAKIGISWQDAFFYSVHGRNLQGITARIRSAEKIMLFTDTNNNPSVIAQHLIDYHETDWQAYVCENMGSIHPTLEKITFFDNLEKLASKKKQDFSLLNILILVRKKGYVKPRLRLHLNEDAYAKKVFKRGLITKKEVRILSIESLDLKENSVIWDIGAASGSIAIEAGKWAKQGKVFAIEVEEKSLEYLQKNIYAFQADNVEIIAGLAPEILRTIPIDPDAIFIGGSKGNLEQLIKVCYQRLLRPGRLVVNAITLENITTCYQTLKKIALTEQEDNDYHLSDFLSIRLVQISRAVALSKYLRYEAQNPIHIFTFKKK